MYSSQQPLKIPSLLVNDTFDNLSVTNIDSKLIRTYSDLIQFYNNEISAETGHLIKNENPKDNYKFLSKLGKGQFGVVYKCQSKKPAPQLQSQSQSQSQRLRPNIVAIKRIKKNGGDSPIFGMNQILRQVKLWKQFGWFKDLNSEEINMILNLFKIKWEILILQRIQGKQKDKNNEKFCKYKKNIVSFIECLDFKNSCDVWMVYECCNLGELLWKRNSVNEIPTQWSEFMGAGITTQDFALKVIDDISQGLFYLKICGIIHRDIKPSNILVDTITGQLKISDFGCSILLPNDEMFSNNAISQDIREACFKKELNKIVGTPAFLPPELCQFDNSLEVQPVTDGFKIDIWALGITIYSILFNKLPFLGDNEFDTYHKITTESLDNDSIQHTGLLEELVIKEMLNKDPNLRINIDKLIQEITKTRNKNNINGNNMLKLFGKKSNHSVKDFFGRMWKTKHSSKIDNNITKNQTIRNTTGNMSNNNADYMDSTSIINVDSTYSSGSSIISSLEQSTNVVNSLNFLSSLDFTNGNTTNRNNSTDWSLDEVNLQTSYSEDILQDDLEENLLEYPRSHPRKQSNTEDVSEHGKENIHSPPQQTISKTKANRIPQSKNILNFKVFNPERRSGSSETIKEINNYIALNE